MHIGILVTDHRYLEFTGFERLKEAGLLRGHTVTPFLETLFRFDGEHVFYEGKPMPDIDILLSRPTFIEEPSLHEHVFAFLRKAGYTVVNTFPGVGWSKNKLDQHRILSAANLPLPTFAITQSPEESVAAAQALGFPVIVKVAFGTHGKGVFYADSLRVFKPIVDYLAVRDKNPLIIEEYIAEASQKDVRAFVIGENVVASMERSAPENDIRANASSGGTGSPTHLSDQERSLALAVAKTFQLDIAGVDLIRSSRGPLVLEVNANPGFSELERVTNKDIASAIIQYLEQSR